MFRAFAYLAYSLVVVALIARFSSEALEGANGAFIRSAIVCALCGTSTFVTCAIARRFNWGFLAEYLLAMAGRTGAPSCVALICATLLDVDNARAVVLRLFACYALTAPAHVWLTFPPSARGELNVEETETRSRE